MGHFGCLIQQEGSAAGLTDQLEGRLRQHHLRHYPDESVTISWTEVAPGYMFTEGDQSTSSIISCHLAGPTTLDHREVYMRGVCDVWTEVTGCTDHEVVVSVTETDIT